MSVVRYRLFGPPLGRPFFFWSICLLVEKGHGSPAWVGGDPAPPGAGKIVLYLIYLGASAAAGAPLFFAPLEDKIPMNIDFPANDWYISILSFSYTFSPYIYIAFRRIWPEYSMFIHPMILFCPH